MQIRIDAFLSKHGFCSRRNGKTLINKGEVLVNGSPIRSVIKIDPLHDEVRFNGQLVDPNDHRLRYVMLNKPINVLSTTHDDRGRMSVVDLVKTKEKVYPVGRLDYRSTGLVILTNDGDLALRMTHPRYHVPKKYIVVVDKPVSVKQVKSLGDGVSIYGVRTFPSDVKVLNDKKLEIVLYQGMKRQIREMCKAVGLRVISLERIQVGNISLGSLKPGQYRDLTVKEISDLKNYLLKPHNQEALF